MLHTKKINRWGSPFSSPDRPPAGNFHSLPQRVYVMYKVKPHPLPTTGLYSASPFVHQEVVTLSSQLLWYTGECGGTANSSKKYLYCLHTCIIFSVVTAICCISIIYDSTQPYLPSSLSLSLRPLQTKHQEGLQTCQ